MPVEAGPIRTKTCSTCRESKPIASFAKDSWNKRDGHQNLCKECNRSFNKSWHLDDVRKRRLLRAAKGRAKKGGFPCTITEDDINIPVFCPALGLKLEIAEGGECKDNSPSLDKIVPELGYVKGNIVVVSNLANRLKSNATIEQLQDLAAFYTNLQRNQWRKKMGLPIKSGPSV